MITPGDSLTTVTITPGSLSSASAVVGDSLESATLVPADIAQLGTVSTVVSLAGMFADYLLGEFALADVETYGSQTLGSIDAGDHETTFTISVGDSF